MGERDGHLSYVPWEVWSQGLSTGASVDTGNHQTTVLISLEEMSSTEGNRIQTLPPDNVDLGTNERALSSVPHYLYRIECSCSADLSRTSLHNMLQHNFYLSELHPRLGRRQYLAHTSAG